MAGTILHVDDDNMNRQTLAVLLQVQGFSVWQAASGAEGLQLARKGPDIILLDVRLPDVSGFEVCREIKLDPKTAKIPIIQMSGHFVRSEDRVHGLEGGADAYLTKPVEPRELVAHIHALLRIRKAEQAAQLAAKQWQTTFDAVHDGIVLLDRNGLIIRCNPAFARLLGRKPAELIESEYDILAPEHADTFRRCAIRKEAENVEIPRGQRWFRVAFDPMYDDRDAFAGGVAVWSDTTERKNLEQHLQRLALIVEASDDAILGETADGFITSWNEGAVKTFGYLASEIVGKHNAILAPRDRVDEVLGIQGRLRDNKPVEQFETQRLRKDGKPIHVSLTVSGIRDAHGELVAVSTVARNITQRKLLEDQLRQAQKMEAVGRLAGGIAHDFNNLLTVILGYGDLLLGMHPPGDSSHALLQQVRKSGERAAGLTRQLLAFSRKQILQPVVLNLNDLLAESETLLGRLIGEDVDVENCLDPKLGKIRADPGQIEQVILNLAVNSRDAMPRGGKLTFETRNIDLVEEYVQTHPEVRPGHYVLLAVSDTGHGMTPEVRARIFEPFFTTKDVGKGTGLGLSTVYGIIKQSGGHVEVYSEIGRGTTFKIYLPREKSNHPAEKRLSQADVSQPRGTETILLAEDEDGVRSLAKLVLESQGYTVLTAPDGAEALEIVGNHIGPIHMLVTDVVMPRMSGRQLADFLKTTHPHLKVLYTSGYTDEAIVRHGVLEEGTAFLHKPFTPGVLARKVRQVLDDVAVSPQ